MGRGLVRSCVHLFFVSTLLMCAYSNWRLAQDGSLTSLLIQLTSGTGLLLGGIALGAAQRVLQGEDSFRTCRDVVFPVALAAVYLSTLFAGAGVSLSVLLFDVAYALILAVAWLQSFHAPDARPPLVWMCAGFASYKAGWYVGVLVSATLGVPWLATALNVSCLIVLIGFMALQHVLRGRETRQAAVRQVDSEGDVFARALDELCAAYGLTSREMDVFALLARGRTSSHIQQALGISDGTARTHISHIYKKLGVNSQQALLDIIDGATGRSDGARALGASRVE